METIKNKNLEITTARLNNLLWHCVTTEQSVD